MGQQIQIQQHDFSVDEIYTAMRHQHGSEVGAIASFVGLVREHNAVAGDGGDVQTLTLEHYPGMTEKELQRLCFDVTQDSPVLEVLVVHRVGKIYPGDDIVLVCVWSAHRAAAFDSCRSIMEILKHRAPFWKKERLIDRHRWVEKNTSG